MVLMTLMAGGVISCRSLSLFLTLTLTPSRLFFFFFFSFFLFLSLSLSLSLIVGWKNVRSSTIKTIAVKREPLEYTY